MWSYYFCISRFRRNKTVMGLRGATISSFFQDFWEILEMGEIPRGATCPRGATSPAALAQVKGRRLRRPFLDCEVSELK